MARRFSARRLARRKMVRVEGAAFQAKDTAHPTVCDFDASSSSDPDGTAATYAWAFGDGQSGVGKTVRHTSAARRTVRIENHEKIVFRRRLLVRENRQLADDLRLATLALARRSALRHFPGSDLDEASELGGDGLAEQELQTLAAPRRQRLGAARVQLERAAILEREDGPE